MTDFPENPHRVAAAEEAAPSSGDGPGRLIRLARERAGLSVAEFATQLRLTVPTLEALEADDFRKLREPVYVRGYYRKCAKLLPLDESQLLAAYERVAAPQTSTAVAGQLLLASSESDRRFPQWNLLSIPLLIVIAAVIGIGAVLYLRYDRASSVLHSATETSVVAVPVQNPAGAPSGGAATAAETPLPAAAPAGMDLPAASSAAAPASSSSPATPSEAAPAAATPGTEVSLPAAAGSAAAAGSIQLEFHERSWAEVYDAGGRRLLNGMIRAGAHETLLGRPPYSVFLGNAPKVDITYDGRPVDLAGRIRDNATARFQIPLQ